MTRNPFKNPFLASDADRYEIWQMLVERDIDAFLANDWSMVAEDFIEEGFYGIHGQFKANPDDWGIGFANLAAYRDSWLQQSRSMSQTDYADDLRTAIFHATTLEQIELVADMALVHKKFDGALHRCDGGTDRLLWQTLYVCRKVDGSWKIAGFTGYIPNGNVAGSGDELKRVPEGACQHVTAGPYSPVLEVRPEQLVVISGQAAIDLSGAVIGETIEEQTRLTIENCAKQLADAGCTLADVFKCNAYLTDLDEWPRFNEVYMQMMPEPRPVRTAVGTKLLLTLKVELEMWAVRKAKA